MTATSPVLTWCSRAVRAGVHLVIGGVLAAGYLILVVGLLQLWEAAPAVPVVLTAVLTAIAVPLALVPPLLAPVRDISIAAARSLLDADVPTSPAPLARDDRLRAAGFVVAHLLVGALAVITLLFGIPYAVGLMGWAFGSRGDGFRVSAPALGPWGVPLALLLLACLPALALAGRALLRALATPLLGPSASAREQAERHERLVLAERNRIARELHDGVGHALAITTMQASVAEAALGRDEAAARHALAEIGRVGRSAMADLDHSLAVLRDERPAPHAPPGHLPDLTRLREQAAAVGLELRIGEMADLTGLDDLVSREAHQIMIEAVVNAGRHGHGVADLTSERGNGRVSLRLRNPTTTAGEPGRGLIGMRERAALIGATVSADTDGGQWILTLEVPTP